MSILLNTIIAILMCSVSTEMCYTKADKFEDCKTKAYQKVFLEFRITKIKTNVIYVHLSEFNGSHSVSFELLEEDDSLRDYLENTKDQLWVDCLKPGESIEYLFVSTYRDKYISRDLQMEEAKKLATNMIQLYNLNPDIEQFTPKWSPKRY